MSVRSGSPAYANTDAMKAQEGRRRRVQQQTKAELLAATALALASLSVMLASALGLREQLSTATNVMGLAVAAYASFVCARAASRYTGRARRGWAFLSASMGAWAMGQAVWAFYEEVLGRQTPFPSVADVGFFSMIPLGAAALLSFLSEGTGRVGRARSLLDAGIVGVSALLVVWIALFAGLGISGLDVPLALGLAFPTADVVLASLAMLVLTRIPRERRHSWILLALGILGMTASDLLFAYASVTGGYVTGEWLGVGWLLGLQAIGAAAILAARGTEALPALGPPGKAARIAAPFVPVGLGALVVVAYFGRGGHVDAVILACSVSLGALLVARQMLMTEEMARLTRRVESAYERLQAAEASRAQLLNVVTHDLVAPLTPIRLAAEMMATDEEEPPSTGQRRNLDIVLRNVDQLQRLVSDVKDLAHLESGALKLRTRRATIDAVLAPAVESFAGPASVRGVRLEAAIDPGLVVEADEGRLTQVIYNLLSNALKFTPRGGRVVVEAHGDGKDGIDVTVTDTGRGLTIDEIGKLFQPFSQPHAPGEVTERGTGLGLYISRGIARQHQGDLWAESAGLHLGSTFHLRLPRLATGNAEAARSG